MTSAEWEQGSVLDVAADGAAAEAVARHVPQLVEQGVPYPIMNPDPEQYPGEIIERDLAQGKIDAAEVYALKGMETTGPSFSAGRHAASACCPRGQRDPPPAQRPCCAT